MEVMVEVDGSDDGSDDGGDDGSDSEMEVGDAVVLMVAFASNLMLFAQQFLEERQPPFLGPTGLSGSRWCLRLLFLFLILLGRLLRR